MNETNVTFPTIFDLFQHWSSSGYPDYVTGVWSADGSYNLTVGVTKDEAGEAGKQEILDLIENDTSVSFVNQTYSRNYLLQIQDELFPYFKQKELGMVGNGVDDIGNCIDVWILNEKADNEATLNFIAELQETYGTAVTFSYSEGFVHTNTLTEEIGLRGPLISPISEDSSLLPNAPKGSSFSPLLAAGLIGIPLLVFGTYFALRKRFIPVMQTNAGSTVTATDTLSIKDVKELVKESSLAVPEGLDERVIEGISAKENK